MLTGRSKVRWTRFENLLLNKERRTLSMALMEGLCLFVPAAFQTSTALCCVWTAAARGTAQASVMFFFTGTSVVTLGQNKKPRSDFALHYCDQPTRGRGDDGNDRSHCSESKLKE